MEKNVCGLDRLVRLTVGSALVLAGYRSSRGHDAGARQGTVTPLQILAAYAGAELLLTGAIQWCPGNYLLGLDSCEANWWRPNRSPLVGGVQASHSSGLVS